MVRISVLIAVAYCLTGMVSSSWAGSSVWDDSKIIPIVEEQPVKKVARPVVVAQLERPDLTEVDWFFSSDIGGLPESNPSEVFDCVGTIHLVMVFAANNYAFRNSPIRVEWVNPDGDVELISRHPHYLAAGEQAFRTTGIALRRPQGGGLFSLLDHSAGMERFLGEWRVKVWIADEEVGSLPFSVEC